MCRPTRLCFSPPDQSIHSIFCCCCCALQTRSSTRVDVNPSRYPGSVYTLSQKKLPPSPPEDDDIGVMKVVAMYDFTARESSDLTLRHGETYIILHKQHQLWWRAKDKHG
ncbi:tyrosine-protein kinase TXK-like [Sinocyclocheilus rhinocerous]|uniref:tyrosine-protein kinase TXK-like n=1 Tax=Sinocyclocheilus rhinocerous TaxID=307959 RepID=UPI0007B872E3|nr:PREDICTED: tyrosine-protein kinase TXK-like [Sinocyclocheilus rhinocerous]